MFACPSFQGIVPFAITAVSFYPCIYRTELCQLSKRLPKAFHITDVAVIGELLDTFPLEVKSILLFVFRINLPYSLTVFTGVAVVPMECKSNRSAEKQSA